MRVPLLPALLALWLAAGPALASPPGDCPATGRLRDAPLVSARMDNDLLAQRDEGYSSGLQLTLVSPNLRDFTDDACLPAMARWVNRGLGWLNGRDADARNMLLRITQGIYTPRDRYRSDLIVDDRPYAGILTLALGYNTRHGDELRTTLLSVGMLGPSALAEPSQDLVHDIIDKDKFRGWDNQLRDEPLLGLRHERAYRLGKRAVGDGRFERDAVLHWGGAVGNLMTRANAGAEFRFGISLPDDFGSSPVRPAGDNTAPSTGDDMAAGWAWHGFASLDTYWSGYDPSLDGNAWKESHQVDRRPFVAEAALGVSASYGPWRLAIARYFRTREFEGQASRPTYGSVTLSRRF